MRCRVAAQGALTPCRRSLFRELVARVNSRRQQREGSNLVVQIQRQVVGLPANHTLVVPGRVYLEQRHSFVQQGRQGKRIIHLFNDGLLLTKKAGEGGSQITQSYARRRLRTQIQGVVANLSDRPRQVWTVEVPPT